jgi:integrase
MLRCAPQSEPIDVHRSLANRADEGPRRLKLQEGQGCRRRGCTDAEGQGRAAYLSRETVRLLKMWLEHAEIREGAVFRRLIGQAQVGGALNPGSIAPIFKRVAQWIGMPERFVDRVSGHSTRVGATQGLPRQRRRQSRAPEASINCFCLGSV